MHYEAREKALKDIASIRGDGIREGKIIGKQEGIQKVALNMLQEGMDISLIAKMTGLSAEKLEALKKQLN